MQNFLLIFGLIFIQPYASFCYLSLPLDDGISNAKVPDYIPDILIKEFIDRLGDDYSDSYNDPLIEPSRLARFDMNHPSIRDQEYLQHSNLWGHQYVSGGGGELPSNMKHEVKTDAGLPAYCNPPNPCPVGFTSDDGCLEGMENTAAFSREYQGAQDCMCDAEHMFECTKVENVEEVEGDDAEDLESFLAGKHQKNMIAKKQSYNGNPFLQGEQLPIAAKKGFNVQ